MQQLLSQLIKESLESLQIEFDKDIIITHTKDRKFGDFASNIAMMLAKSQNLNPRDFATKVIANLPKNTIISKAEVAGGGFINFFIHKQASFDIIHKIISDGDNFGNSDFGTIDGKKQKVLLEFVSANPTGPLHVGHGRGAAYGATLANIMRATGFEVENEYYVNDAGRQMDILATSVYLRYLDTDKFPDNAYKGDYIFDIAKKITNIAKVDIFDGACLDERDGGDKEKHIDDLIKNCKTALGDDYYKIYDLAISEILDDIKQDLSEFGVNYQHFFSEKSLSANNFNTQITQKLEQSGDIYLKGGAKWFKTTDYGDEKDRVVVRANGLHTYFASDITYHYEKYQRGYAQIINIWGSDHHGYIARVRASIKALGLDDSKLKILLVQFANLYKNGEKLQMSTRSGSFVTLKDLRNEVGNDATRFFYILRKSDQHLDFDMDLAIKKSNENPVFYIQYAHARIFSVLKNKTLTTPDLSLLTSEYEQGVVKELTKYASVLLSSSKQYEPHQLAYYLKDLAASFHSYYHNCEFLVDDENLKNARLNLIRAVQQVIFNGMTILGVSSPEKM